MNSKKWLLSLSFISLAAGEHRIVPDVLDNVLETYPMRSEELLVPQVWGDGVVPANTTNTIINSEYLVPSMHDLLTQEDGQEQDPVVRSIQELKKAINFYKKIIDFLVIPINKLDAEECSIKSFMKNVTDETYNLLGEFENIDYVDNDSIQICYKKLQMLRETFEYFMTDPIGYESE